jgi:uncharacterized phage-associated protein
MYSVSSEEIDLAIKYLNGEDDGRFLDTDIADRLQRICRDIQKKMHSDLRAALRDRDRYETRLQHHEEDRRKRLEQKVAKEDFGQTGLDSAEVARGIVEALHERGISCNRGTLILLTYECYCAWLASRGEILTLETPVATKYGPQFWRVFKNVDPAAGTFAGTRAGIAVEMPGVASLIRNVVAKYGGYSQSQLADFFKKSAPYRNAMEERGGKDNGPIKASDIWSWKKGRQ